MQNQPIDQAELSIFEVQQIDVKTVKSGLYNLFKLMLPINLSLLTFLCFFPTSYHKGIVLIDFLL